MQEKTGDVVFPDEDLIFPLVDLYFRFMNPFYPLLHRPAFERGIMEGLHLREPGFAWTVLLVCAIGSRWSNDPRVFYDENFTPQSAGWQWFIQVPPFCSLIHAKSSVYELQICVVSAAYHISYV